MRFFMGENACITHAQFGSKDSLNSWLHPMIITSMLHHSFSYLDSRLKVPKNGYWCVVKEISHATAIEEIINFSNVKSDMGRGMKIN
jgi:hypothetical protein